jgi:hypothetical protein
MEMFLMYIIYKNTCVRVGKPMMSYMEYIIFAEQMRLTNLGY